MPCQAASGSHLDLAEWEIDLVVNDDNVVKIQSEGAPRGAHGLAGLVHVRLREQDGHAWASG